MRPSITNMESMTVARALKNQEGNLCPPKRLTIETSFFLGHISYIIALADNSNISKSTQVDRLIHKTSKHWYKSI